MKYLILLAILAVAYLLWRNARLEAPIQSGNCRRIAQIIVF